MSARGEHAAGEEAARASLPAARAGAFDIATVLILYVILTVVVLTFVGGFAGDVFRASRAQLGVAAGVMGILAAGILALSAAFIYRSIRDRSAGGASAYRLRARLALAFFLVALAATVPQALFGWRALTASSSAWFSAGALDSVTESERLAVDLSSVLTGDLKAAAETDLPALAASLPGAGVQELLSRLSPSRERIVALQSFAPSGASSFAGDRRYRVEPREVAEASDGDFPSLSLEGSYAIRYLKTVIADGRGRRYLLSLEFPASWVPAAAALERSAAAGRAVSASIPSFRRVTAIVYLVFTLPLLFGSLILAYALADSVTRPLEAIERATRRVADGDMGARVLIGSSGNFASLSASFNRMVSEIDRYRAVLLQEEKENAWKDVARKLAHEVKNPLTPIRLSAERVLRRHRADPASVEPILEPAMLAIIQEVDGLSTLLADFKDFARLPEPCLAWTALKPILDEIAAVYAQSHPGVAISDSGVSGGIVLKADPGQLRQLFVNLATNAIDAMDGAGRIDMRADLVKYSNTNYCRIEVRDSGPGIPADIQGRLFTPYFTTKENGTGLGLSIAEHIVMSHGGRIWFESEPGAGTAFYVDLPADPARTGTGS